MKTTEENNRMIAEFMGVNKNNNGTYELPQFGSLRPSGDFRTEFESTQLKFHTSWDWLMPVVEECAKKSTTSNQRDKITFSLLSMDINKMYNAVVQFIEWYNENK